MNCACDFITTHEKKNGHLVGCIIRAEKEATMFIDDLVDFLKKHYKDVSLCRDELGNNSIHITENGVTLILFVTRLIHQGDTK